MISYHMLLYFIYIFMTTQPRSPLFSEYFCVRDWSWGTTSGVSVAMPTKVGGQGGNMSQSKSEAPVVNWANVTLSLSLISMETSSLFVTSLVSIETSSLFVTSLVNTKHHHCLFHHWSVSKNHHCLCYHWSVSKHHNC